MRGLDDRDCGKSEAVASRVYRGCKTKVGVMAAWLLPGLSFSVKDPAGALSCSYLTVPYPTTPTLHRLRLAEHPFHRRSP